MNRKLIAVVEIGGDKATQFWARADDLIQAYSEKLTGVTYAVVKKPYFDNLFKFYAVSKEKIEQSTLLKYSREFFDDLLTLIPSECVKIKEISISL
ncbi:hypothetical protein [Bacteroides sp. UBA939]|uniref:hypothetical protein n=1 Tax=Bacteroides sp. UBA939 TaxID=1946092 RepID=UPI0025BA32F5|nr:hypothetical protein [Bacteroides sp. UBA939]